MKTLLRIVLVGVLAGLPLLAAAGDEAATGTFQVGAWGMNTDGSPDMVTEYETNQGGPQLQFDLASHGTVNLLVDATVRDSDDSEVSVDFDIRRMVRSHNSYTKLLHRLGHDPLTYMEGTSTNGKVVQHTDHNPWQDYDLTYAVLESRTEFQFPGAEMLTFGVLFRDQHREGHRQALVLSHCDTCHINGMNRPINEHTRDAGLEAKLSWNGGNVRARYTARRLRQNFRSLTFTYADALHPEKRLPLFDDRLQYDSAEGPLPVDLWPDIDKDIARLDIQQALGRSFFLTGTGVWSTTENRYTGLKASYSGYMATVAGRLGRNWRLRWRGRVYSLDNDDFFVDTNERTSIAGPTAGKTYRELYNFDPDFLRRSTLNRSAVESAADLSYRFGRAAGTLKFTWNYRSVDRDNFVVTDGGDTKTTTNLLGISWRARPARKWRLDARYRHASVDNPFMSLNQLASTWESPAYPNPFTSPQYFDFQDARIGDGTASPTSWDEFRVAATYNLSATSMFNATYRWWSGDNSDGDLTDWSRTNQSFTLMFSSTPISRWTWFAGYNWMDSSLDAPTTIPIFDG